MKKFSLQWFLVLLVLLSMIYPAYALKTALGIDIVEGHHTSDLIKKPIKAIAQKVTN